MTSEAIPFLDDKSLKWEDLFHVHVCQLLESVLTTEVMIPTDCSGMMNSESV